MMNSGSADPKFSIGSNWKNRFYPMNGPEDILECDRAINTLKWSEEKINEYNNFLSDLKKAHDNYVFALQNEIISKTKHVIKDNPNSKGFNLEDPQFIEADIGKFSENTIYKGLWDKKKKKYSRISHIEAGIDLTPFEEVKFIFNGFGSGYTLTDTSNKYKTQITVNLD